MTDSKERRRQNQDSNNSANGCKITCPRVASPLSLKYPSIDDFTSSPCFSSPYVLCVLRAIAAAYLISWWLFNISTHMDHGKMFIYFTNLSFTVIAFYFIFGFNLSCISIKKQRDELYRMNDDQVSDTSPLAPFMMSYNRKQDAKTREDRDVTVSEVITTSEEESSVIRAKPLSPTIEIKHDLFSNLTKPESIIEEKEEENVNHCSDNPSRGRGTSRRSGISVCYEIYWMLFYISSNTSVVLTLGYWYGILDDSNSLYDAITKHFVAMAMIAIEFLISRIPVYMCHVIYPILFTAFYNVFAVVYWATGGTDPNGREYIYNVLNYSRVSFKQMVIPVLSAVLLQPLIHLGFYIVATVRRCLDEKLCRCRKRPSQ